MFCCDAGGVFRTLVFLLEKGFPYFVPRVISGGIPALLTRAGKWSLLGVGPYIGRAVLWELAGPDAVRALSSSYREREHR